MSGRDLVDETMKLARQIRGRQCSGLLAGFGRPNVGLMDGGFGHRRLLPKRLVLNPFHRRTVGFQASTIESLRREGLPPHGGGTISGTPGTNTIDRTLEHVNSQMLCVWESRMKIRLAAACLAASFAVASATAQTPAPASNKPETGCTPSAAASGSGQTTTGSTANSMAVGKNAILPSASGHANSAAPTVQSNGEPMEVRPECPPDQAKPQPSSQH